MMIAARPIAFVAEDEALIRMEAADLLADFGFDVRDAPHAAGALCRLEATEAVTLLFTDIHMPGRLNGHDLAHTRARRWPETAIIVCSGCLPHEAATLPDRAHFIAESCVAIRVRKALKALSLHGEPAQRAAALQHEQQSSRRNKFVRSDSAKF